MDIQQIADDVICATDRVDDSNINSYLPNRRSNDYITRGRTKCNNNK